MKGITSLISEIVMTECESAKGVFEIGPLALSYNAEYNVFIRTKGSIIPLNGLLEDN